ncbi:MAG TPA: AIM24 family protein, partial [bacterium]|nr:AIM24 family protein [bacterium]
GETIVSEAGELSWMTASIEMQTHTQMGGGGGILGAIKRVVGGGTLFMTEYKAQGAAGMVAFATKVPGQILKVDVHGDQSYMIHRRGFLCATPTVQLGMGFQQSLGAGIFGGDGFVLQKISGPCSAWIELDGEVVSYDLKPGETLRVHPGHVGMFESRVHFGITTVKGFKNMIFGGDGIFLAALTGPGRVWLQSLPLPTLAHALIPYMPAASAGEAGVAGGVVGAVIKGITS